MSPRRSTSRSRARSASAQRPQARERDRLPERHTTIERARPRRTCLPHELEGSRRVIPFETHLQGRADGIGRVQVILREAKGRLLRERAGDP